MNNDNFQSLLCLLARDFFDLSLFEAVLSIHVCCIINDCFLALTFVVSLWNVLSINIFVS